MNRLFPRRDGLKALTRKAEISKENVWCFDFGANKNGHFCIIF